MEYTLISQNNSFGIASLSNFNTLKEAKIEAVNMSNGDTHDPVLIFSRSNNQVVWVGTSNYFEFYVKTYGLIH